MCGRNISATRTLAATPLQAQCLLVGNRLHRHPFSEDLLLVPVSDRLLVHPGHPGDTVDVRPIFMISFATWAIFSGRLTPPFSVGSTTRRRHLRRPTSVSPRTTPLEYGARGQPPSRNNMKKKRFRIKTMCLARLWESPSPRISKPAVSLRPAAFNKSSAP